MNSCLNTDPNQTFLVVFDQCHYVRSFLTVKASITVLGDVVNLGPPCRNRTHIKGVEIPGIIRYTKGGLVDLERVELSSTGYEPDASTDMLKVPFTR